MKLTKSGKPDKCKAIDGFPGYYIHPDGYVLTDLPKNKGVVIRKNTIDTHGYYYVTTNIKGIVKNLKIHRLIGKYFVENPDSINFKTINHKDGNKLNNSPSNLEWCTCGDNLRHAFRMGLIKHETDKIRPWCWKPIFARKKNVKICFKNISEASKICRVNVSCISKRLSGITKCGRDGYKWSYLFNKQNDSL